MANHRADKMPKLRLNGIEYFRAMIFAGHILLQMSEIKNSITIKLFPNVINEFSRIYTVKLSGLNLAFESPDSKIVLH